MVKTYIVEIVKDVKGYRVLSIYGLVTSIELMAIKRAVGSLRKYPLNTKIRVPVVL